MAPFTFPTKGVAFDELLLRNKYGFIALELKVQSNIKYRENTELTPVLHVSDAPANAVFPSVAICKLLQYMD